MYRENYQEEEEVLVKPEVTINVISSINNNQDIIMKTKPSFDDKERF